MRCPSCNKFAAMNTDEEPEIDVDIDEDGRITGTCRIVNQCEEDGEELKEANFDIDEEPEFDLSEHQGEEHELTVEVENEGRTDTGGGRYAKRYYGAEATFVVGCSCKPEPLGEVSWSDQVAASEMEELA